MAFEFLMAAYLLDHNVIKIVKHLPDFHRLGYNKLPRAVEEAILIYIAQTDEAVNLFNFSIDQQTMNDFTEFLRIMKTPDMAQAKSQLMKYNYTYWYYLRYNSPKAK